MRKNELKYLIEQIKFKAGWTKREIYRWLETPTPALDGKSPQQLIVKGQEQKVLDYANQVLLRPKKYY